MAQVLMSRIFAPERIDSLFKKYATVQYQQDLSPRIYMWHKK